MTRQIFAFSDRRAACRKARMLNSDEPADSAIFYRVRPYVFDSRTLRPKAWGVAIMQRFDGIGDKQRGFYDFPGTPDGVTTHD